MSESVPTFDNWLAHGWGVEATSAHQVLRLISNIALLSNDRTFAWRGQNDATYPFSSSLYRQLAKQHGNVTEEHVHRAELDILREARKWALGRDLGPSATDLHLLAILQHHGVPTRLIDVTSNPMTALWFATEEHRPNEGGHVRRSSGTLFAIDVTDTDWYETFAHEGDLTWNDLENPLGAIYRTALTTSAEKASMFRAFPALPDERMKAQEGFFLGSAIPDRHQAPGVFGLNPLGPAPGDELLSQLLYRDHPSPDVDVAVPFCAIVIPPDVKDQLKGPLKHTYNRRRRVLFPDVDGFREGLLRNQLD